MSTDPIAECSKKGLFINYVNSPWGPPGVNKFPLGPPGVIKFPLGGPGVKKLPLGPHGPQGFKKIGARIFSKFNFLVIGYWYLVIGIWLLVLVIGYWYWLLVIGFGYWLSFIGYRLLGIGYWR